jgi:hypothetical protein
MDSPSSTVTGYTGVTASRAGFTGAVPVVAAPASGYDAAVADTPLSHPEATSYPVTAQTPVPTTAPPAEEQTSQYAYEWEIGPTSDLVNSEKAMALMQQSPNVVFPFGVRGADGETTIQVGHVYYLDHVRAPGDRNHPVRIADADKTSFTFVTLPGHFRGAGRMVRFRTLERDGRLLLRQEGRSAATMLDGLYDAGARIAWRYQADNLRAAIFGGERADFPGTVPPSW